MIIYQEFLALNEELPAFDPSDRLRYAIHEIMIRLKDQQTITFIEMSKNLKNEFKIDIPSDILKDLFEKWDRFQNPDYSIFKKEDKNWMDVFPYQNYIKRKSRDKQSFGKHRKKDAYVYTPPVNNYATTDDGYWVGNRFYKYGTTGSASPTKPRIENDRWGGYGDYYGD